MRVIDLLNKIANGEEVPKKIKIKGYIFKLSDNYNDYNINYAYEDNFDNYWLDTVEINKEIEIIEEDKEIEDTRYMRHHEGNGKCYIESKGHKYYVPYDLLLLIDDLVKAVNELKKGK